MEDWTLLSEVGASLVPQNPIGNMGAFAEVLRQKQLLRDPNNPVRPEEETPVRTHSGRQGQRGGETHGPPTVCP